ncbi:MAG: CotH kinase family protein [candidate division WOR-3 bacterium]
MRAASRIAFPVTNLRRHTVLVCGLWLVACGLSVAGFFDLEQVNEIRLYFAESNWDEILDSLYARGLEERLVGTAVINGIRFDSVGVRYKGYSSYNPNRKKNPFNIKLDYIKPGQTIEGHGTLRLANIYKDPSCVREALSYEITRKYMPAGRSNYADIYVNDTLIGLYSNNEDPDKHFMREHFYCDENARFKGRIEFDSVKMMGWKYLGPDSIPYLDYFELESVSGWPELIALFDTLNNHNEALDRVLDVDRLLWMLAFDILLVNLDSPINTAQNYYLYRDASNRFNPIVWDLNESFGAFRELYGTGLLSLTQMQQLDPFLRSADTQYPICSKVLNDARRRRMFVAHARTVIADVFTSNWYRNRALEIQHIIDAHVQADRNKFYTYNDFLNNVTRSVGSGPLAIVGLTELMNARTAWLLSRPEFQASAPVVSDASGAPYPARPNSHVQFLARIQGADSVWLGLRQNPALRFVRAVMYDDGLHGDSSANDGLYGVRVRLAAGNVEYYVYAENPEAGTFFPARAEREFLTLPVANDVVLNEFMAINEKTVQDPSGQYDDWIELYNNSSQPVSLDDWLLTNDSTNITRWAFPDTTIPARGYLVVWADNDLNQPGLHANFKLAGSSGILLLSDPDGRPIDRVTYGPQFADISYGRYPNGTGRFILMNPTFAAANDSGVGIADPAYHRGQTADYRLDPHPNPFLRSTTIHYALPVRSAVLLRIFDVSGRLCSTLVDAEQSPGSYEITHAVQGQPSGVYFAQIAAKPAKGPALVLTVKLAKTGQ